MNAVKKDEYGEMSKAEVIAVLISLDILGISEFDNVEVSNESPQSLTSDEMDTLLASNYFYQVIDLTLKEQLEDAVVPQ